MDDWLSFCGLLCGSFCFDSSKKGSFFLLLLHFLQVIKNMKSEIYDFTMFQSFSEPFFSFSFGLFGVEVN